MRPHSRRGASLVELIVVIGVASTMVGISVTTIHRLLSAEREHERMVRSAVQLSRLSRQFREDVHLAADADLDQGDSLRLTTGAKATIAYSASGPVLTRIASDNGREAHRETFRFPRETTFAFFRDADAPLVRVTIETPRNSTEPNAPPTAGLRRTVLESHLGLDRRWKGEVR